MSYKIDVLKDSSGNIIRPATVSDNVINPDTRNSVTEDISNVLNEINSLKGTPYYETTNYNLELPYIYYKENEQLKVTSSSEFKGTTFRSSSLQETPLTIKIGDKLYIKAQSDYHTENITVFLTEKNDSPSISKEVLKYFTNNDTKNGLVWESDGDYEIYVTNKTSLENNPEIKISRLINNENRVVTKKEIDAIIDQLTSVISNKQNILQSGVNIKTINNISLLGEGNIDIDTNNDWQTEDLSNYFGNDINRLWTELDGLLRIKSSSTINNSTGCHEKAFGGTLVTVEKGDNIEITCGISKRDYDEGVPTIIITSTEGDASIKKAVIKTYNNDDTLTGISFTAEENIEIYVNNNPSVVENPSIVIKHRVKKDDKTITNTNYLEGKTMLCIGASSIGGQSKGDKYTKYYGYPLRTCELLGMNLINRMQYPRIYASGGKCYKYSENGGTQVIYTDLTPNEFTTWSTAKINNYHFQITRGERTTSWSFVSYSNGSLVLKNNNVNHTFTIDNNGEPLSGLFNLGSSATIQEFVDSGRADRKGESYENYLLNTNYDIFVISDQGTEVDGLGEIDEEIIPLMRRPTTANKHYHYSDNVSLEDRRNSNTGSILYLIDKAIEANPKVRIVICNDGILPSDMSSREFMGVLGQDKYNRFLMTELFCAKFGFQFIKHNAKFPLSYANESVYIASDHVHPSDEGFKLLGEMFAHELLSGTNDANAAYWTYYLKNK